MEDLSDRLKSVMGEVLEVDASEIDENSSPKTLANWDSMRSISLLLSIEEAFGVEFSDIESVKLDSFSVIQNMVREKLSK